MNRRTLLIANWKMNFTIAKAVNYATELKTDLHAINGIEIVLCPHFLALAPVREALAGSSILLGAQDAHWAEDGAHTGQISASMLRGLVEYVIIGHSETRTQLGITDEMVRNKLEGVLDQGLKAIVCIGENGQEFREGRSKEVVRTQIERIFEATILQDFSQIVIAYEPIWAIGTGLAPVPRIVNELVTESIRKPLAELCGKQEAESMRIVYGGSIVPDNLTPFTLQPQLDGTLVGGASLDRRSFFELANITRKALTK